MADEENEIVKLIDSMISGSNELIDSLKSVLPDPIAESVVMFQESNIANLKRIRRLLDG